MQNLLAEGVPENRILVTGNTCIDSIQWLLSNHDESFFKKYIYDKHSDVGDLISSGVDDKIVLITLHRREHFGPTFLGVINALKELAYRFPVVPFVYPVHPNPNVKIPVYENLEGISNIHLIAPLDYISFVYLMKSSYLILTDSGGVQEEAPSLGKPILVLRETTERPEGIEAGTAVLVGTDSQRIVQMASLLLTDQAAYSRMSGIQNPYGDGMAAELIVEDLRKLIIQ